MKNTQLYSEIVKQLKRRANPKIAAKKVATSAYFGVHHKSCGIKESEVTELIKSYSSRLKTLNIKKRRDASKTHKTCRQICRR